MGDYLLGLEVQDFTPTMFASDDLSTIRGASLMALDLVNVVVGSKIKSVSLGGSSGIWRVSGGIDAKEIGEIRAALDRSAENCLSYALAAVPLPSDTEFIAAKNKLKSALARQQSRTLSDPYPEETGSTICPVDLVRPVGSGKQVYRTKIVPLSPSVITKRRTGMTGKQAHIAKNVDAAGLSDGMKAMLEAGASAPFALLLSSISEGAEPPPMLRKNLHDKIAVIHIDGNRFGKVQKAFLGIDENAQAKLKTFDVKLGDMRKQLVTAAMMAINCGGAIGKPSANELAVRNEVGKFRTDKVIRMEMLLWGGDEMTFIVPARLGWAVADATMAAVAMHWKLDTEPLTASIGLIFCHHDAPITRIRALADNLAMRVKDVTAGNGTHIWPMVLESFDHVGGQIDHYLDRRTRITNEAERNGFFVLTPELFGVLQCLANSLAEDPNFSRSRLRALAQAAHDGRIRSEDTSRLVHLLEKTPLSLDVTAVLAVLAKDPDYRRAWMLLEEYWDYLIPCPNDHSPAPGEGA